ncbi:hybrid sensor histidine kinase/response regulator transcription factor [Saccharicrinis fermentans]|uniref:hybrid sensor histidine kinase/response regulator transcription factor n=2 Tax=Saccharicrinis fermentans TaxID=982 RepID=UPI00138AF50B|nr:hybrid sensor histidine kinase/response regulator transcription factor [Saccharicrinis fermentans]
MGIVRYSKNDIRTYKLPYENVNVITTRLSFFKGKLYAYTNNGQIFDYDPIKDQFLLLVDIAKSVRNPYLFVSKLLVDNGGRLWISSSSGLFRYDSKNGLKLFAPKEYINYMQKYGEDHLLISVDNSLYLLNINTHTNEVFFVFPEGTINSVSYIKINEKKNAVWIGTMEDGLFVLEIDGAKKVLKNVKGIPKQPILAIENFKHSQLLIGIDGQGVWGIDKNTLELFTVLKEKTDNPNSLKGNGVYDIFCDSNNQVWVCTYTGGASYMDVNQSEVTKISHITKNTNSLINDHVNSTLEDCNGNLWFATNNGISKFMPKKNKWKSFYYDNANDAQVFLSLCEDEKGRIWAGTYSSGVYVIDAVTDKEIAHFSEKEKGKDFISDFVFDIHKDLDGDVWIGGIRGNLIHHSNASGKLSSYEDIVVSVMLNYDAENILIGAVHGLSVLNKQTGIIKKLLEGYLIVDMCLVDDNIWICTTGNGVIKYNYANNSVLHITEDEGLPSNFTNGIIYIDGYFWIGTENGVCKLNERNYKVKTFNDIRGLSNISFNRKAHCLMKDGSLLWGTNNGAVMFNPLNLESKKHTGQMFLQEININGHSIREMDNLEINTPLDSLTSLSLSYYQNNISLELIPIRTSVREVKFSWKLEGLDTEWSKPINSRVLSYSNIPSGTYTLKIRMYDSSISEIIGERELLLDVTPPYWQRWWFKLILLLIIFGIGIVLFLFQIHRLKEKHSKEKIRFFANTAHDIRTSLTLINGPIEELNSEAGLSSQGLKYLHLAIEQSRRLSNVVTRLMDFQKVDVGKENLYLKSVDIVQFVEARIRMFEAAAKRRNLQLIYHSNLETCNAFIDEIIIEKVLDNLLSNAIKYAFENTPVTVNLQCFEKKWVLEVTDQGIGISKAAQKHLFKEYYRGKNAINAKIVGSGIGLLLVKNYVLLHGGSIKWESQTNQGARFFVTIPIKKDSKIKTFTNAERTNNNSQINNCNIDVGTHEPKDERCRMRVVIVEDNEYLQDFLSSALHDYYEVFVAKDGSEGWKIIAEKSPDLVVSDIMMPGMDGFELCHKIKSTYETSHIAVILLTALADQDKQIKGFDLGADDYLTKPFNIKILKQRINSIIHNREIIRDKALKIIKHDENKERLFDNELNDVFLKKMVEVVKENINNSSFSKDDFAAAMNVSSSLLYKKVKSLTNLSPSEFIKSIRLDFSLELIQMQKYSVTEVSELSGFSSVAYFSTVFRKHYGKSPTQIF